ncbi:MAG: efflux RND transporter permease subunit, partial [Methanomicrobiales archaeon]|nr:efflux RND transporter permease subunit [Methanomicrobiales archaeon]
TSWRITGQNEEMQHSIPSLYLAVGLAILLMYILLASEFESLGHPFIIMFCVPFGMIGMSLLLLVSHQTINVSTLIGILMVSAANPCTHAGAFGRIHPLSRPGSGR